MFKQYRELEHGEEIVVGCDTAAGGLDYCSAQFLSKTKLDVPLVYHSKILATEMTNEIYPVLNRIYDKTSKKPVIAYERQNGGVFEMDRFAALNKEGKFTIFRMPQYGKVSQGEAIKLGWDTNSATRPKMLSELKEAIEKKLIQIYDKQTINELFSFVIVETSASWKAQAEQHAHDDNVMALAIAWQLYQMTPASRKEEDSYRVFSSGGDRITGYGRRPEGFRTFKK